MADSVEVKVLRLDPRAKIPKLAYHGDACADLFPLEEQIIESGETGVVNLGFATEIPVGWEACVRTRSSQGFKHDVQVHPGTIDSGFRGAWSVKIFNHGKKSYTITPSTAVAQVKVQKVPAVSYVEANSLSPSQRGEKGYGSSDHKSVETPSDVS